MGSDTAIRLAEIENDGYTIIENVMSDDLMSRIREELAPYCQGKLLGRNNFEGTHTERVYALLAKAPSIAEIVEHPATLELIDQLLPPNYLLSAALSILVHPGETPQPFHYDDGIAGLPVIKPRCRFGVSTIWAFDDFTEINGATEVIPGSHPMGRGSRTPGSGSGQSADARGFCRRLRRRPDPSRRCQYVCRRPTGNYAPILQPGTAPN